MQRVLAGLRAAGESTRLRLLAILAEGERTVGELTQILGQSQPRVSRHLKLLCDAGLVNRFREGARAFYRLADDGPAARLARQVVALVPREDPVLARDRMRLDAVRHARAEAAAAYFRANAHRWDALRSLHVAEAKVEAAMLAAAGAGPIADLVDLGTGTGRILEVFAPCTKRAVGIDLSHEMLAVARTNLERAGLHHCQVRQGDIYSPPLPPRSADLVTLHQVLHYLDRPAVAIAEAARLLRPGGLLLVADFAPHEMDILREEHAHRRLGFAEDEVAGWCREAGLALEGVRRLPPPTPASVPQVDHPADHSGSPPGQKGLTVVLWCGRQPEERAPAAPAQRTGTVEMAE